MEMHNKCSCEYSTGSTHIECCNICGLPLQKENWHFFLPDEESNQVQAGVMPNEVVDGGLTDEEQDFMEMIINWQMESPKTYERIKAFADISISRATLFSALADYASQREA